MDKRFFLALFLSLIVIAITQFVFPSPKRVPAVPMTAQDSAASIRAATPNANPAPVVRTDPASVGGAASPVPAPGVAVTPVSGATVAETTSVVTPKARYQFSSIGAAPVSIVISNYQNRSPTGGPVDLAMRGSSLLGYRLVLPADTVALDGVPFQMSRTTVAGGGEQLRYNATVGATGVVINYTIPADTSSSYTVKVTGTLSGVAGQAFLLVDLPKTLRSAESDTSADQQSLAYSFKPQRDRAGSVLFDKLDPGEKRLQPGPLTWVAVKNKYFVLGMLALKDGVPFSEVTLTGGPRLTNIANTASATAVQALKNNGFGFEIYAGPQESQRLMALGREFDTVNPYGWGFMQGMVHPIASKVIEALLWMHNRLNLSYGWVLVILGILIRLALWPLNQSTMRSSLKMQELQPKLAAVQKKYKDNPLKQREAIMAVYSEAGVSPFAGLTGCLPALLPMPILFALFFVFQNTIEFRGVPFLWLHDISIKDPFYILPILMGLSMYVLSWIGMRNAPPNPQAKMMMYMFPVMMTAVLLNMASGLNLYYTAQNVAALPQQWLLARERARVRTPA